MNSIKLDIQIVTRMGFDVLSLLTERIRQETGRQFDMVWKECISELKAPALGLFNDIRPDKENMEINNTILRSRFQNMPVGKDEIMVLDAFAELVQKILERTKRILGEAFVDKALKEAKDLLTMVGKYQQDPAAANYFLEKIKAGKPAGDKSDAP